MTREVLTREGDGRRPAPLVFVHGARHAAWCWEEHLLDWFAARGYECHAPSPRGGEEDRLFTPAEKRRTAIAYGGNRS